MWQKAAPDFVPPDSDVFATKANKASVPEENPASIKVLQDKDQDGKRFFHPGSKGLPAV
jgi:hypothetical protein